MQVTISDWEAKTNLLASDSNSDWGEKRQARRDRGRRGHKAVIAPLRVLRSMSLSQELLAKSKGQISSPSPNLAVKLAHGCGMGCFP